jgi:phosphate transport system protein
MMEDPTNIKQATQLLFVARYLERVADHATNIGEWVIYLVTGQRMRKK